MENDSHNNHSRAMDCISDIKMENASQQYTESKKIREIYPVGGIQRRSRNEESLGETQDEDGARQHRTEEDCIQRHDFYDSYDFRHF